MNAETLSLSVAWSWLLAGFLSGLLLGLNFHREAWLGGYGSLRRRLYRLAHISFFGLGTVNFLFFVTVHLLALRGPVVDGAAILFVIGAVTMPICCVLMAHWPKLRHTFAVPVLSLIAGAALTLLEVL